MIQKVLQDEMDRRHLTYRDAAHEIGTTHNTIMRILNGEPVTLETLIKISEWSGMSIGSLVGMEQGVNEDEVVQYLYTALIESDPSLKDAFMQASRAFKAGKVDAELLREIAAYVAIRIAMKSGNAGDEDSAPPTDEKD